MYKTSEEIRTLLNERGVKVTPQRMAVYAALQTLGHASAEQITKAVHDTFPTVTVGTIYNVLECFSSHGIISRLNTSDNKMYFDINVHDHHHLLCEDTGEIRDFGDQELSDLVRAYYATHKKPMGENFEVKDIRIQIIGNYTNKIQ
ncbi:MAG TPA: transcriptional repressor [Candidatus Rikenella faecigallinarum]|uniref:Transcriptional repressor n=1 Tax=Candidatus Rikenella faecigallinarum TaxID=2838745 RepID=A0A9D1QDC3_9BACT|nr:transcriptional repressor [Candidatus Rikenella faecigallinarum]